MCLILLAYHHHPRYHLILAANRDEFYDRPTLGLEFWTDHPEIAAGRDLQRMGTWLGITRKGRLAAITNYREPGLQKADAPSRGHLVADFLAGRMMPDLYLQQLSQNGQQYNGFNLIVGHDRKLCYYSNRGGPPSPLPPGIHGLSNKSLNTEWPKVRRGKTLMAAVLAQNGADLDRQRVMELLQDKSTPADDELPDTGVGIEWERILAPIFIQSPTYGTRCSSLLTIDHQGNVDFTEITWDPSGTAPTAMADRHIRFRLQGDWK